MTRFRRRPPTMIDLARWAETPRPWNVPSWLQRFAPAITLLAGVIAAAIAIQGAPR
jgi:hypothetical protein